MVKLLVAIYIAIAVAVANNRLGRVVDMIIIMCYHYITIIICTCNIEYKIEKEGEYIISHYSNPLRGGHVTPHKGLSTGDSDLKLLQLRSECTF